MIKNGQLYVKNSIKLCKNDIKCIESEKTMSRFITKQGNKYIEEIESMEVCKMKYNGVCCNDKCPDLGDYPYPSMKCEGSCVYFEKEGGK